MSDPTSILQTPRQPATVGSPAWNDDEQVDRTDSLSLHQFFEAQVSRTPAGIAVVFEDEQLTYQELSRRSNMLAGRLRGLGVGSGTTVALCMERSLEIAIGLLGILKAGGACMLLDPASPKKRKAFMLQDTGADVLLTQHTLLAGLPRAEGLLFWLYDEGDEVTRTESERAQGTEVADSEIAFVVYTSGSTGTPKGVELSHRSVGSMLLPESALSRLTATDGFLLTSYTMLPDFFWAWLAGARAIVATDNGYRDSSYLVRLIAQEQVTVACMGPSMLQALLEEEGIESCNCLRRVISGGESISVKLQERFFRRVSADLQNTYGLTETGSATSWECEREQNRQYIPVGHPCANVEVYLLDSHLQPVQVGVSGEIFIGGPGLARGYLNQAALTAQKFLPNPFSDEAGTRLYRSGDLARCLPDGNIEFLGRRDFQVKIRGYRVELEEVESVLLQNPAVRKAAVIAREHVTGRKTLAAYVEPAHDQTVAPADLRRFLRPRLSDYMIPAVFVVLDRMPLTRNGKVDRNVLPPPETVEVGTQADFVLPTNAEEEILAAIWAEVLEVERIGIHDNFFEFGGDSLLATEVVLRVREAFQIELTLSSFFEAPTVAELIERLDITHLANGDSQARAPEFPDEFEMGEV